MALDAAQVEQKQNETPTNWATFEQEQGQGMTPESPRFAADAKLHVRFYSKPKYNPDKSTEQNRPIYEDTVYVEIMMPGEKHNIIQRPALSMRDDLRFPKHFEQFTKGQSEQMTGTPLKVLPFLSEAQAEELAYFKVRTVEQLADLSDNVNFMGANEMKQRAKKFLDSFTNGIVLAEQNRSLQAQLDEMRALIEERTAPKATAEVDPLS